MTYFGPWLVWLNYSGRVKCVRVKSTIPESTSTKPHPFWFHWIAAQPMQVNVHHWHLAFGFDLAPCHDTFVSWTISRCELLRGQLVNGNCDEGKRFEWNELPKNCSLPKEQLLPWTCLCVVTYLFDFTIKIGHLAYRVYLHTTTEIMGSTDIRHRYIGLRWFANDTSETMLFINNTFKSG